MKSKYATVPVIVCVLAFWVLPAVLILSSGSAKAQTVSPTPRPTTAPDPVNAVDHVLCSMGLGCAQNSTTTSTSSSTVRDPAAARNAPVASTTSSGGGLFGFGGSRRSASAILYGALISKAYTSNEVTLVRVAQSDSLPGELQVDDQIFEIIRGKKHLIPSLDIFFDYGFKPQQVQFISHEQLNKYSLVRLFKIRGDKAKTTFYVTDTGMIRKVLNQDVFDSYGNRPEDIVEISKKEFNFYPENKYVYLERPFTGDIYIITGDTKRFLTPMAVRRLDINASQIAPINQTEFNAYKTGAPVIF